MTDFDPTDPWGSVSPWDQAGQNQTLNEPTQEAPVTNQPVASNPNPFKIGFTLKAATGFDAEWLTPTVYGSSAQETAERGKELLLAMRQVGLIDLTSQAAEYTRGQYKGGSKPAAASAPVAQPSFNPASGQVQYSQPAPAAPAAGGFTCNHGARVLRKGNNWEAYFCPTPKGTPDQCPPMWKQKDGTFK
ncbi:hypothetical protein [Streptomyces ardesiacus]|uniref:hypothetical protein n=1 Tax=Streptomyces ardesiacus TaxID=285564 RepID=UPI00364800A8